MTSKEIVYTAPAAKVVQIKGQSIVCSSGNESMYEVDLGDGGFLEQ